MRMILSRHFIKICLKADIPREFMAQLATTEGGFTAAQGRVEPSLCRASKTLWVLARGSRKYGYPVLIT